MHAWLQPIQQRVTEFMVGSHACLASPGQHPRALNHELCHPRLNGLKAGVQSDSILACKPRSDQTKKGNIPTLSEAKTRLTISSFHREFGAEYVGQFGPIPVPATSDLAFSVWTQLTV
jgi:hypothetical protein